MSEFSALSAKIDHLAERLDGFVQSLTKCQAICSIERATKSGRASWARTTATALLSAAFAAGLTYYLRR